MKSPTTFYQKIEKANQVQKERGGQAGNRRFMEIVQIQELLFQYQRLGLISNVSFTDTVSPAYCRTIQKRGLLRFFV